MVIYIMGVSGSGKSTVGQRLASVLGVPFIDADDHHPSVNVEKMRQGIALNDQDRQPWLERLHHIATEHLTSGCVIACSALKEKYRQLLENNIETRVRWVYLQGTYALIFERMQARTGHFMDAEMLRSQFATLEEPTRAIQVDIEEPVPVIVQKIKFQLV